MVVGYELLEHLEAGEQAAFLRNVRHMLAPNGLFFLSSPEKKEYAVTYQSANEFHKHEMTLAELESLLKEHFEHVHLCAQRVLSLSTIWRPGHWYDSPFHVHFRKELAEELRPEEVFSLPLYTIAICGNSPLPEAVAAESNSFYLDVSSSDQTKDFPRWAVRLQGEIRESAEVIQSHQRRIAQLEAHIAELEAQIEDRTRWALSQDSRIREQDSYIHEQNGLIESLNKELDSRAAWAFSLETDLARLRRITSSTIYRALSRLGLLPR
jgi:hypothetical protein